MQRQAAIGLIVSVSLDSAINRARQRCVLAAQVSANEKSIEQSTTKICCNKFVRFALWEGSTPAGHFFWTTLCQWNKAASPGVR
jgi:hypothetical protein